MKKLKIVLLSSILATGLGQVAHAIYSQEELVDLRSLVESGNSREVMSYLSANPQLMNGSDPLADALREFVSSREGLLGGLFGPRLPNLENVPDLPDGVSSDIAFDTGSLSQFGS